ncbi:MAG: hypothetical protein NC412_06815 [Roseburia sp.]|nr:hypothetical protein [Roseburia sp.]MCM1277477.1 hypothetical protein [Robinsoniella sp.]
MEIFQSDTNIVPLVYTARVSDEEYTKKIMGFGIESPDENLVKYYDDITEEILTKYFMVKKCPGKHIWYGEWENHRRIVIKLYCFYSYEVIFGYNYDFIPILNKQDKFIYHRTEKAVDLDVKDFYINHINYEPDNLTHMESFHIRRKYELPVFGCRQELDFAKKYIGDCVRTNIPFMQDFFEKYKTDWDVIAFLDYIIQNGSHFESYRYIWTKAFLYARLQEMEKAMETMDFYYKAYYKGREIPEKVIQKLKDVYEMD